MKRLRFKFIIVLGCIILAWVIYLAVNKKQNHNITDRERIDIVERKPLR